MKTKKVIASVLALTLTAGAVALPLSEVGFTGNLGISASAYDDVTWNDEAGNTYKFAFNDDGTTLYLSEFNGYGAVNIPATVGDYKVTAIGIYAFQNNTDITSIDIPEGVTEINNNYNEGAFYKCTSLTSVKLPSTLTYLGSGAFNGCTSLDNVIIPSKISKIDSSLFYGCTSLKNVTLPDSIVNIGENAFEGCTSLSKITIPKNVKTISAHAFSDCTSLSKVTIPNGVTTINNSAFNFCTSLKTLTVPKSVTSIGDYSIGFGYGNGWFTYQNKIPNFTIIGTKGSAAETYAKNNGLIFKDPNYKAPVKITKPAKQTITKIAGAKKAVKVYYKKNTKATGYKVQIASNSKFKGAKTVVVSSNKTITKTIKGLKSKKKYYVRVLSYKKSGSKVVNGSWSAVKSVKTK